MKKLKIKINHLTIFFSYYHFIRFLKKVNRNFADKLVLFDLRLIVDLGNLLIDSPKKKHMFQLKNCCCSSHPIKYFNLENCRFCMDSSILESYSKNLTIWGVLAQLLLIFRFLFLKRHFFLFKKGQSMM